MQGGRHRQDDIYRGIGARTGVNGKKRRGQNARGEEGMPDQMDDSHLHPPARQIARLPIRNRSSLPTYPNGWFRVASSEEVTADSLLPLTYFGTHYIAFRAADGTARVADAYYPHLGAHLASHTGKIENGTITCPFHRWQFAADNGQCTRIN